MTPFFWSRLYLVKELGHFPVAAELQLRRRQDARFPSDKPFRRFGGRTALVNHLKGWCENHGGLPDDVAICAATSFPEAPDQPVRVRSEEAFGSVYLLKSGRYYKIGRTNAVGRRERELSIQLPEKAHLVPDIKTDDPNGIE